MAKLIEGERVGKLGKLAVGCSASVFDASKQKMLLVCRSDCPAFSCRTYSW